LPENAARRNREVGVTVKQLQPVPRLFHPGVFQKNYRGNNDREKNTGQHGDNVDFNLTPALPWLQARKQNFTYLIYRHKQPLFQVGR
jgi:hypothetical protein